MSILFYGGFKLLVGDLIKIILLCASSTAIFVFCGEMKGSPGAQFVLVIGNKFNLLRSDRMHQSWSAMGIYCQDFLAVVLLPMNKGHEQAARLSTEHVLKDASIKVVLQLAV